MICAWIKRQNGKTSSGLGGWALAALQSWYEKVMDHLHNHRHRDIVARDTSHMLWWLDQKIHHRTITKNHRFVIDKLSVSSFRETYGHMSPSLLIFFLVLQTFPIFWSSLAALFRKLWLGRIASQQVVYKIREGSNQTIGWSGPEAGLSEST